jgi:cell division GTPase FtsZ
LPEPDGNYTDKIAEEALGLLKDRVDTIITIPNDKILNIIDQNFYQYQVYNL